MPTQNIDFDNPQIVVAMDHAGYFGVAPGPERPGEIIDSVVDARADAIVTSFGVARRYRERLARTPPVIRVAAAGKGVVFGRNIWQNANPSVMVHALRGVIHEGLALGSAVARLAT